MFGLSASRCAQPLRLLAWSAAMLSFVLCEDIKNSDNEVKLVSGDLCIRVPVSGETVSDNEKVVELAIATDKAVKAAVVLMENTEPKSTGWSEKVKVHDEMDITSSTKALRYVTVLDEDKHYCIRLRTSDDKSYYGGVFKYSKGALSHVQTLDGKKVESNSIESFGKKHWLMILLIFISVLVFFTFIATCASKK